MPYQLQSARMFYIPTQFTLIPCYVISVNYQHITCSLSLQSSLLSAAAACAQPHGSGEVTLHLQAPSTAS